MCYVLRCWINKCDRYRQENPRKRSKPRSRPRRRTKSNDFGVPWRRTDAPSPSRSRVARTHRRRSTMSSPATPSRPTQRTHSRTTSRNSARCTTLRSWTTTTPSGSRIGDGVLTTPTTENTSSVGASRRTGQWLLDSAPNQPRTTGVVGRPARW